MLKCLPKADAHAAASGCFLFSFTGTMGVSQPDLFTPPHTHTHKVLSVLGGLIGLGHPTVSFWTLSHQAAPQVSLTKATSQGAPDTQEAVLVEEGRQEGGPGARHLDRGVQIRCRGEAQE